VDATDWERVSNRLRLPKVHRVLEILSNTYGALGMLFFVLSPLARGTTNPSAQERVRFVAFLVCLTIGILGVLFWIASMVSYKWQRRRLAATAKELAPANPVDLVNEFSAIEANHRKELPPPPPSSQTPAWLTVWLSIQRTNVSIGVVALIVGVCFTTIAWILTIPSFAARTDPPGQASSAPQASVPLAGPASLSATPTGPSGSLPSPDPSEESEPASGSQNQDPGPEGPTPAELKLVMLRRADARRYLGASADPAVSLEHAAASWDFSRTQLCRQVSFESSDVSWQVAANYYDGFSTDGSSISSSAATFASKDSAVAFMTRIRYLASDCPGMSIGPSRPRVSRGSPTLRLRDSRYESYEGRFYIDRIIWRTRHIVLQVVTGLQDPQHQVVVEELAGRVASRLAAR
jgi:hypothetical protein